MFINPDTTTDKEILDQFLHANCDIFAEALKEHFSKYSIETLIYEKDKLPIHIYCTYKKPGGKTTYFIDARGITTDWNEFVAPYAALTFSTREDLIKRNLIAAGNFNNPPERNYDYSKGTIYERDVYNLAELWIGKFHNVDKLKELR